MLACIIRLLFIQFFRSGFLSEIAAKQHTVFVELEPLRGTIFDTNHKPQAINLSSDSLYACPNEMKVEDKNRALLHLPKVLNVSTEFIRQRIFRKKSFIWIARKISPEQSETIKSLKIHGLGFIKESKRSYPNSYLSSHVIGFAGTDNNGLEGLEMQYEKYLGGKPGWALFLRDARQRKLDLWEKMVLPKNGYDIVLTIDEVIQYIAERELDRAYRMYRAQGASIVVMDPYTGAILAMANRPSYDLNSHSEVSKDRMRNRALSDMFEPGSVFKIVTASAALEENKVQEDEKFFCENGAFRVVSHTLHDHRPHGWLTFKEVIGQSSNIGTVKVAQRLGNDCVYRYARKFGFGSKLGIDIQGEISGSLKDPRNWSKISIASIPIGQEVGVTALQLASAISVIANGGDLMKPYVVKEISDKSGEIIKEFGPVVLRNVISQNTAKRMAAILQAVVDDGTGQLAKIQGITSAGKTGTAQKLEPNGAYSHNKYVASYIGFAPVDKPLVAIVVTVDEPHPYYFGGVVAAPVFKNVAADAIRYLQSRKSAQELMVDNESIPASEKP